MKKLLSMAFAVIVTSSAAMSQEKRIYLDMTQHETFSLDDPRVKELMSAADFKRCQEGRKAYLASGATQKGGNPSVLSISGAMAFFTVGVDSIATYFDYVGSTSAFDQVGFQIGKASASMFDTTMVQYVQTMPADQLVFVRKNCESGVQYRFKFFVFDAASGTVTFYPTGNGSYYATTVFVPMATITSFSMSCATKKMYFWRKQNAVMAIKGRVDTLANFSSSYLPTHGIIIPVTKASTSGVPVLDSINLAPYMVAPGPIANYFVELIITYSAVDLDSTNVENCTVNTTGVDELEAGKAFKLFPNPNPTSVESIIDGRIDLIDLTGKVISSEKILAGQTMLTKKDVPSGLYFYQLSNLKGEQIITVKTVLLK